MSVKCNIQSFVTRESTQSTHTSHQEKKFRENRGNKDGAVAGFRLLQESGLGEIVEKKAQRGTSKV